LGAVEPWHEVQRLVKMGMTSAAKRGGWQVKSAPQTSPAAQVPHEMLPPHPSLGAPQV
jgi:hypothetical protein